MSINLALSLTRGNFRLQVDANLPARGVTAIFGESGCGKTSPDSCLLTDVPWATFFRRLACSHT